MTCPNCGAPVADNRRFCGKCGAALAAATPPDDPNAPAPATSPAGAPPSSWGAAGAYTPPPPPPAPPASDADPFAPPDLSAQAGYGGPPPPYPPAGYGAPPPPYQPGYPAPPGTWPAPGAGYGYTPERTNGLAVASLVLGLVGWVMCGIGSVLAIVFGFIARDQIKRSWGRQTGGGMATAGIVLGFVGAAFWILIVIGNLVSSANAFG